jgi:Fuc2NAc and GlcNAc transferase
MPQLAIICLSAVISAAATGLVLRYARRRLLDQINERSSHSVPTPRGGGLGLTLGMLLAWLLAMVGSQSLGWQVGGVAVALGGMAALGWWDDHADLPARLRLVLQFVLTALALVSVGVPDHGTIGGWQISASPWLIWPIALVGSVWLVNLYNFMDGIDGIAGGQGLVAGAAAGALLGTSAHGYGAAMLGWSIAGACLGFLLWNRPPARIFMGDVGSTTLGLAFAVLVVTQVQAGVALDLALLPLAPFILDATCTLARRAWRRERLSQAHRSHLYQRLARYWGAHLPATLLWSGLALLGTLGAWLTMRGLVPPLAALAGVSALYVALILVGRRLSPA